MQSTLSVLVTAIAVFGAIGGMWYWNHPTTANTDPGTDVVEDAGGSQ